jgi:hypothetical protein
VEVLPRLPVTAITFGEFFLRIYLACQVIIITIIFFKKSFIG